MVVNDEIKKLKEQFGDFLNKLSNIESLSQSLIERAESAEQELAKVRELTEMGKQKNRQDRLVILRKKSLELSKAISEKDEEKNNLSLQLSVIQHEIEGMKKE